MFSTVYRLLFKAISLTSLVSFGLCGAKFMGRGRRKGVEEEKKKMSTNFYECDACGFTGNGGMMLAHQQANPTHTTQTQTTRIVGKPAKRKGGVNLAQNVQRGQQQQQPNQNQQ